jgi:hypothetical protein
MAEIKRGPNTSFTAVLSFAGVTDVTADQVQTDFEAGIAQDPNFPGGWTLTVTEN